jgi:hypothetical protein
MLVTHVATGNLLGVKIVHVSSLAVALAACGQSSSASSGDPCAVLDSCPITVNSLLWCRDYMQHPKCADTLRAWADCWHDHCQLDAQVSADAGDEGPCGAQAAAHEACRLR